MEKDSWSLGVGRPLTVSSPPFGIVAVKQLLPASVTLNLLGCLEGQESALPLSPVSDPSDKDRECENG